MSQVMTERKALKERGNPTGEIRLILGDQLNAGHSWYEDKNDQVVYVLAEMHQEQKYVRHHVQKIVAFFMAMRNFAEALASAGHQVLYLDLDETADFQTFPDLLDALRKDSGAERLRYQRPDEHRLLQQLEDYRPDDLDVACDESEHFLLPFEEIPDYFSKNSNQRMETFYRKMRQRFTVLMADDKPEGGKWNYDTENRNKLKAEDIEAIPEPLVFAHDTAEVRSRLEKHEIDCFGELPDKLPWPVSRKEARELLSDFCERLLPAFGEFQDAMTVESPHAWSLYHSRLSFALNTKMLDPLAVIQAVEACYHDSEHKADLAQCEGFIRQILGWREFVRGIYWTHMPDYASSNKLLAQRNLPDFFWTGDTKMRCLSEAIGQSLEYAYAHHIQRLMVTGNFCLLAGINPNQVDAWYLGIYIDAIEWVELPNTRGMSQFADGGIMASKPYSASANYMHKMSDYCQNCEYDHKGKAEEDACPFNSLYWHFMDRQRKRIGNNPRTSMVYRGWDKRSEADRQAILDRAEYCLENLDKL